LKKLVILCVREGLITGNYGLGEFDKLNIVDVGESLTNWLLWAWGKVCQTGYCWRGEEFDKLVIMGVGDG
jgi:hypothetical protein